MQIKSSHYLLFDNVLAVRDGDVIRSTAFVGHHAPGERMI
jgi:hypothetical protein